MITGTSSIRFDQGLSSGEEQMLFFNKINYKAIKLIQLKCYSITKYTLTIHSHTIN